MKPFLKRRYQSFRQFYADLAFLFTHRHSIKKAMKGETLPADFRERIILAVTGVNQCRYCSYVHTRLALKTGISKNETDELLKGVFGEVPSEERIALAYAQHWAEQRGNPDPEVQATFESTYSPEQREAIYAVIRLINFNNLCGNTLDWILHTLSFGIFDC